jgi:hypothetical protein
MRHLGKRLAPDIERLDSLVISLKLIQDAFEQAQEKFNVDDYYDILISLDRAKEIKEKLYRIMQRQT